MNFNAHGSSVLTNTLAGLGFLMGAWGAWTGQKAYDRSIGPSSARLSIEGDFPTPESTPRHLVVKTKLSGEKVHFKTPRDLVDYGPRIVVENIGREPIGDVQVETWLVDYIVDNPGAAVGDDAPTPDPGNRIDRRVYQLPFKLMPGKKAVISVCAGLISQILDLQHGSGVDQVYHGRFRIRCYPRLIGAMKFDAPEDEAGSEVDFAWSSGGFTPKSCVEHLRDPESGSIEYIDSFGGR